MPRLYTEVQQGTIQFFGLFFLSMKPLHSVTKDFYTPDLTEVKQVNPTNTTTEHTEPVCYYLNVPNASGETNKEECKLLHAYCSGRSDL